MADREQSIEEILRDAGVTIEPGMLVAETKDDEDGPQRIRDVYDDALPGDIPVLTDPATYALCLAQLARRLGLDPEQGVILQEDYGTWTVTAHGFTRGVVLDDIPTDIDYRRALALALRATAPKETT